MALDAQQKKDAKYLAGKTREELNVLATQHGVEDAGNEELYKTKDDLAEAVVKAGYKRDDAPADEEEQPPVNAPAQDNPEDTPSEDSPNVEDEPEADDAPADETPAEEPAAPPPRNKTDARAAAKAEKAEPGTTTEPLPVIGGVGPVIEVPTRRVDIEPTNPAAKQLSENLSRKQLENLASARGINSPADRTHYPDNTALANEVIRTGYDAGAYAEPAEFGASNVPAEEQGPKPPFDCEVCQDTGLEAGVPKDLAKLCPNCNGTPSSVKSSKSTSAAKPASTKKKASTKKRKSRSKK